MRKSTFLLRVLFKSAILGSLYWIVWSQLLFFQSDEYFTQYKIQDYGISKVLSGRLGTAVWGFLEGAWIGTAIGIGLGLLSLIQPTIQASQKAVAKSLILMVGSATLLGIAGSLWWAYQFMSVSFNIIDVPEDFYPPTVKDRFSFHFVNIVDNCFILGGIIGLIAGAIHQFLYRRKMKRRITA